MISGGANGVWIMMILALIFLYVALYAAILLTGVAALLLVALLVFLGVMALYGEMYFAFGKGKTNEFLGCFTGIIIGHSVTKNIVFAEPYALIAEILLTIGAGYEMGHECLTDLFRQ